MAIELLNKIKELRITNKKEKEISSYISNWGELHRWTQPSNRVTTVELIIALKIELENKKRYAIVKRLHQLYCKRRAQEEFDMLEPMLID